MNILSLEEAGVYLQKKDAEPNPAQAVIHFENIETSELQTPEPSTKYLADTEIICMIKNSF